MYVWPSQLYCTYICKYILQMYIYIYIYSYICILVFLICRFRLSNCLCPKTVQKQACFFSERMGHFDVTSPFRMLFNFSVLASLCTYVWTCIYLHMYIHTYICMDGSYCPRLVKFLAFAILWYPPGILFNVVSTVGVEKLFCFWLGTKININLYKYS